MLNYKGVEFIKCSLCGQDDTKTLFKAPVQDFQKGLFSYDEWNIVKCKNCGLVYVNPRISQDVVNRYYKFEIEGDHFFLDNHFIEMAQSQIPHWKRIIRLINQFKYNGNLLDLGCGNGTFLYQAKLAGYNVEGQDISPYFINYCKTQYDFNIYEGELNYLNLPSEHYDVITMFDVIEHHLHPLELLQEIKRILKPDGILVISTHDIGNPFAKLYGKKWRMIYPIGHLTYYSKQTLMMTLQTAGFKCIKQGGGNIVDDHWLKEVKNFISSIFTTLILRSIIIYIYKPLCNVFPFLGKLKIKYNNTILTYDQILFKAGNQLISNDEIIAISKPISSK